MLKSILKIIIRICFNFVGKDILDKVGNHITKWKAISISKNHGGWGFDNIHRCKFSLVAKSPWNLIIQE